MPKRIGYARQRMVPYKKRRPMPSRKRTFKQTKASATLLAAESKFLDVAWNNVTIPAATAGATGLEIQPSTGCTNAISVPAQGDGESERDGRKYVITSVWCSGSVDTTPASDQADVGEAYDYYFALVLDTQTNGAAINSEDVFVNPGTDGRAMLPQPLRNLQNSKRFRILASQQVKVPGTYSGSDGTNTMSLSHQVAPVISLSWRGKIVCDSLSTTANVTSAADNSIHLIGFVGAASAGGSFTLQGKSRIRFQG